MELDVVLLSRIQFALTVMFHYLFPPLTIGMGIVLVYLGAAYLRTKDPAYRQAQKFWTKVFALNFAMGVASGIVMEFQFGTNWAAYSRFVGDVFGSALAAEGIFAFFLESGFLAVLVFGWNRVGPKMHFFSTCMVALGSIFSSIWIVVANSWMQTPAGSHLVQMQQVVEDAAGHPVRDAAGNVMTQPWFLEDGTPVMRAEITDFWALVFNPSAVDRLTHVLLGCFIMGAFFILSISAWYIIKNKHVDFAKRSFRGALVFATVSCLAISVSGHFQAQAVVHNQPAKLAAFENHWDSEGPAPLTIFGIPDPKNETVHFRIAIPGGLSFLAYDDFTFSEPVIGLDSIAPEDRPNLIITFWSWRIMVGIGVFFVGLTLLSCYWMWRGTLFEKRWLMWVYVVSVLLALVANQIGWIAAEVGRQPWVVHPPVLRDDAGKPVFNEQGYLQYETATATMADGTEFTRSVGLRTSDGVSQVVAAEQVGFSIVMFLCIYILLGAVWVFLLNKKIQHGPEPPDEGFGEGHPWGLFGAARTTPGQRMADAGDGSDTPDTSDTPGQTATQGGAA
ncbi:MAG: cytochrome ubiquinol oxidase subunit I [Planctomycetota bacterium]